MVLPPGPMISRIWSGLTCSVVMRGAYFDRSSRGAASASAILPRMKSRPSRAWRSAVSRISRVRPWILMSICTAVTPVFDPADLEVHVAQVILVAEDVGQHGDAIALLDEAHGDAGDRRLDRHAGVHQRQDAAAHRRHRRAAVRLEDLRHDADRVREVLRRRAARARSRARPGGRGRSRGGWRRASASPRRSRRAGSCSEGGRSSPRRR